ncbi:MAG: flagellar motor switch protein FliN [Desulfovibrio sp.]|jgi:flagellar motor switch protein FliN/FliY|nr:flagellar motor switch protein FliN [Desulfovibrio sp.]
MSQEEQEALAAEWAAQLEAEEKGAAGQTPEAPGGDAAAADAAAAAQAAEMTGAADAGPAAGAGATAIDNDALAAQWAASLAGEELNAPETPPVESTAAAHMMRNLDDGSAIAPNDSTHKRELEFILDIPLEVSTELGRARLLINELLQLGQGSVVELNKLAGEPLEVYVNGKLVAKGEAVVVNEKFGVRLTDIISPAERIKQLG